MPGASGSKREHAWSKPPHETPESFWRIGFTDESEQQRPASSDLFDPFAFDELAPHQGGDAKRQRLATRTFSRKAR